MVNPLKHNDLSGSVSVMPTLNDRVREKLRTEKDRLEMTELDIAGIVGWSQSKVAQKLRGRTPITLDELEAMCFAFSMMPSEAVRDQGFEFVAEMTPLELRLFQMIRKLSPERRGALLTVLGIPPNADQPRRATPPPKKTGPQPRAR